MGWTFWSYIGVWLLGWLWGYHYCYWQNRRSQARVTAYVASLTAEEIRAIAEAARQKGDV